MAAAGEVAASVQEMPAPEFCVPSTQHVLVDKKLRCMEGFGGPNPTE